MGLVKLTKSAIFGDMAKLPAEISDEIRVKLESDRATLVELVRSGRRTAIFDVLQRPAMILETAYQRLKVWELPRCEALIEDDRIKVLVDQELIWVS